MGPDFGRRFVGLGKTTSMKSWAWVVLAAVALSAVMAGCGPQEPEGYEPTDKPAAVKALEEKDKAAEGADNASTDTAATDSAKTDAATGDAAKSDSATGDSATKETPKAVPNNAGVMPPPGERPKEGVKASEGSTTGQ